MNSEQFRHVAASSGSGPAVTKMRASATSLWQLLASAMVGSVLAIVCNCSQVGQYMHEVLSDQQQAVAHKCDGSLAKSADALPDSWSKC